MTVSCTRCGRRVTLPLVDPDYVSIKPLDGWTMPPLLCPDCTRAEPFEASTR